MLTLGRAPVQVVALDLGTTLDRVVTAEATHTAAPTGGSLRDRVATLLGAVGSANVLLCLPAHTSEPALREAARVLQHLGVRLAWWAPAEILAGLGAGVDLHEPVGTAIVEVGASHSSAAILSYGGLVDAARTAVGIEDLRRALDDWLAQVHGVRTDTLTILRRVGLRADLGYLALTARELRGGHAVDLHVDSAALASSLAPVTRRLVDPLRSVLATVSPELLGDLMDRGVLLTGGLAVLPGLDQALGEATGLAVLQAESPRHAIARGAQGLVREPELLQRVAFPLL